MLQYDFMQHAFIAGTIVAAGPAVRRWRGGDRVVCFHHVPCRSCFFCERRLFSQCFQYKKVGVTAGFDAAKQLFYQHPRAAPLIAIDHYASGVVQHVRDGVVRGFTFKTCVSRAEDNTLQTSITRNELKRRSQKWPIVFVVFRIQQMNTREIAFAALSCI